MSKWTDRIKTHNVWQVMQALGVVLDEVNSKEIDQESAFEDIERIRAVLTYFGKRLASIDPILLHPSLLGVIEGLFNLILAELSAYINDNNPAHFSTCNARVDELIAEIKNLPSVNYDDLTIINESVSSYRSSLEKHLQDAHDNYKKIKTSYNSINNNFTALENSLLSEQQKLALIASDFQTQFLTAQNQRATDFSSAISEIQSKISNTVTENQSVLSKNSIDIQEKISLLLNEATKKFSDLQIEFNKIQKEAENNYQADLSRLNESYENTAKSILLEVSEHKNQVEKLVGVIGNLGVTSGYLKTANNARKMVYLWQVLTILALGGLIWIAYKMAFPAPTIALDILDQTLKNKIGDSLPAHPEFYQGLSVRIFLSITFGIFAAYSAKQADKFLKIDNASRKLALELEALGPFISSLPQDMQHKFRSEIGERTFGTPHTEQTYSRDNDPVSFMDLIYSKKFEEIVTNIIKKVKS